MEKERLYEKWKETQLEWDDTDFLEKDANALMKKRWKRLNKTILKEVSEEVISKNEYVDFLDIGAGRGDYYKVIEDTVRRYAGR